MKVIDLIMESFESLIDGDTHLHAEVWIGKEVIDVFSEDNNEEGEILLRMREKLKTQFNLSPDTYTFNIIREPYNG